MAREFYQDNGDLDQQLVKGARRLQRLHEAQPQGRTTGNDRVTLRLD